MEISGSDSIDVSDYGRVLRKHIVAILLIPVLCVGAALGMALRTAPTYHASSSVYLSLQSGDSVSELVQGSNYVQTLVRSYASIASMPIVLDPVIDQLGLDMTSRELSHSVKTSAPLDTSIIKIEVSDHSPAQAAAIANAITDQLAETATELASGSAKSDDSIKITTVDPAVAPEFASSPNKKLNVAAGLVLGLLLAGVYVAGREMLDTRIRSEGDLGGEFTAPLLSSVPAERTFRKSPLSVHQHLLGPTAESFRVLRTNLQFVSSTRDLRSIVVTSASPGEGKSTVSISLAETYAQAEKRVLLIDADMRRPSLATAIGLEGGAGLSNVLAGTATIEDVFQEYGTTGVTIVAAGRIPPNPSELLGSAGMRDLLEDLRDTFDIVILDTAPILPVTDATVLAQHTDATLLVLRAGKTTKSQLKRAMTRLTGTGITPVGFVLNSVAATKHNGYTRYGPKEPHRRFRL